LTQQDDVIVETLNACHFNTSIYVSGHCILHLQEPALKISTTLYFRDRISHHPKAKSRGYTF